MRVRVSASALVCVKESGRNGDKRDDHRPNCEKSEHEGEVPINF